MINFVYSERLLGSHLSPTETVCYLTADMFYIEVVLLLGGKVEDVRVAHHGEAPVSSPSFLQLLRMKKFQEFSQKLEDLVCFYNIPGESDVKIKIYTALRHLENDLLKISHLPRSLRESDLHVDLILNGRIGNVQPGQEGTPMKMEYHISRLDVLRELSSTGEVRGGQVALVTVGSSDTSHRLQMESLISTPPQVDFYGFPLFQPLGETGSALLPATFLLKLQPPLPMLASFIEKMGKITGPQQHLQVEPLPQLLMKTATLQNSKRTWTDDLQFDVPLPGSECHSYVFSAAEWDHESWKGALIHTVPFTHPGHVPALLDTLRYQSAINVLLASCFSNHKHHTVFVMVADSRQLSCRLLMPDFMDHNLDDYISRVLMRCMSIPITMRAIRRTVASMKVHHSPDQSRCSVMESNSLSTPVYPDVSGPNNMPALYPSASHEADGKNGLPSSAGYYVMSVGSPQAANNANTDAVANPSPCASLGVYSHWVSGGVPAELL
ncbi:Mediator of RNA polymerase II transcription subunit 1 [Triplophysa tibetana]|uniref:Mediator of RNA polymerase II transcription subunit 1 n=1 Tax=Triplophysa tibetana TaxID=1572043 RepID=A0A5A9N4G9_9TELE|nr:Mediator of RNA polymerase II transcription subunit 1 [Triplophysa tibetana]